MTRMVAATISGVVLLSTYAKADNFTFSFTNTLGNVSGTVTGEIIGLTNNSTGPASAVIITSFPAALDSQFGSAPINATDWTTVVHNTFTESGGVITSAEFEAADDYPSVTSALMLLDAPITSGSVINVLSLDLNSSAEPNGPDTGPVVEGPNGFSGAAYAAVPEPSSLVLTSSALLMLAFIARRRIAPRAN